MMIRTTSPRTHPRRSRRSAHHRRAFTLIETSLAIVIVGVGVIAIMGAQEAFHKQNSWSTHASIAAQLGNEMREMTISLPLRDPVTGDQDWGAETGETLADFDDLDDFDGLGAGLVFSDAAGNGPINARREIIPNMAGWGQEIRVFNVNPYDLTDKTPLDGTTNAFMVEVIVTYQGPLDTSPTEMTTITWLAPN